MAAHCPLDGPKMGPRVAPRWFQRPNSPFSEVRQRAVTACFKKWMLSSISTDSHRCTNELLSWPPPLSPPRLLAPSPLQVGRFNWPTRNYIVSYSYNGIRNRSACKNREGKSIRHTQARIIDPLRWISTRPPRLGQCSSAQGSKFKPKVPPRGFLQRWRALRILWIGVFIPKSFTTNPDLPVSGWTRWWSYFVNTHKTCPWTTQMGYYARNFCAFQSMIYVAFDLPNIKLVEPRV